MREKCPHCGRFLVPYAGPVTSKIALVGEFPGYQEIERGIPWVGKAGQLLERELARAGIQLSACKRGNIWLHNKLDPKDPPYETEFWWHIQHTMDTLRTCEAVLLIGSDVADFFIGQPVSSVNGLAVECSDRLPSCIKVAVACFNPAYVLEGGSLGELRLALKNFAHLLGGIL